MRFSSILRDKTTVSEHKGSSQHHSFCGPSLHNRKAFLWQWSLFLCSSQSSVGRRKWQPTAVFLPGKSHGQRSLSGSSHKESDMTERECKIRTDPDMHRLTEKGAFHEEGIFHEDRALPQNRPFFAKNERTRNTINGQNRPEWKNKDYLPNSFQFSCKFVWWGQGLGTHPGERRYVCCVSGAAGFRERRSKTAMRAHHTHEDGAERKERRSMTHQVTSIGEDVEKSFRCSVVSDSVTPWAAAYQASLSSTISQRLLTLVSMVPVMPSNHKLEPSGLADEINSFGGSWKMLNTEPPCEPPAPLVKCIPKRTETCSHRNAYTPVHNGSAQTGGSPRH